MPISAEGTYSVLGTYTLSWGILLPLFFHAGSVTLQGQSSSFSVEGRSVEVHGFASQGFALSNQNNYLTMNTASGSFAFTDFGGNLSVQFTPKFRAGAQIYDRNIGSLGDWHPELDWADIDYKFADCFGVRAGKVKTVFGLYNDTQDYEFLHTWALLPQSVYPLDLRSSTIAHVGADLYGDIGLKQFGSLSYAAYAGHIPNDRYGGFAYGLQVFGVHLKTYNGRVEGGDLRWNTPLERLLLGASYMNQDIHGTGVTEPGNFPHREQSRVNETSQFYVQYTHGALQLDGEYRRQSRDELIFDGPPAPPDVAWNAVSFYGSASYRVSKRLQLGTYYSRFYADWDSPHDPPANHVFDKVVTARFDLTSHWDLKVEGHFIDGYANADALRGFYLLDNPLGLKPTTNLLVIRTGFNF